MCGISAIFDPRGVSEREIEQMNAAQAHRGPDGLTMHIDGAIGLGHQRLSIIDVDGGTQPIFSDDRQCVIIFNGEIYNYQELRPALEQERPLRTQSDTEVVLRLYERHGPAMLEMLRGMFSLVIWDSRDRSVMIARDHLGQKPLYYAHEGERLTISSEIKGVLAVRPHLRVMNDAALHEYLTLRIITPPRSMYEGVSKLAPGHFAIFKDGALDIKRYWDLEYRPKLSGSDHDLLDELDARLAESVRYHLVSDVPVGAFLSGGMDSSLIVAMMTRFTDEAFPTFSGEVPYEGYSELPYARAVAEKFSTEQHEITINPSLIKGLPDLVWHLDEPSDPLSVCMYHIAKLAGDHVKVVLGGDGGDELFGGYDRYFGNQSASWYAMIPEVLRRQVFGRLLPLVKAGGWYRSVGHQLHWMHQMAFFEDGLRYGKSLSYFYYSDDYRKRFYTDSFIDRAAVFDPEANIATYFDAAKGDELLDKMLYADSNTRMVDHPVMISDRMCMAHGVEARSPFMDHKLAEFCAGLPSRVKVRGRKLRVIQKALAARLLPESLLKRGKQGFSSPLAYILADEYRHLYEVLLRDARLVSEGYLRADAVTGLVDEHLGGQADHGQRLWQLVNAESWYRMNIEGIGKDGLAELIQ